MTYQTCIDSFACGRLSQPSNPRQNHLLACIADAEWQYWQPFLELIELPLEKVLYGPGTHQEFVYFPTSAIVSLLYVLDDGSSAEIAMVGCEGMVGISILMGGGSTPSHAVVQGAGMGFRLRADAYRANLLRSPKCMQLMLRFAQALSTQMSQIAVCNRHHSMEKQFSRWLLLFLDRSRANEAVMTHERISNLLGVRRETVTEAARKLQAAGLIHYERGHIWLTDRVKLEARTCECYRVVNREYGRLLPNCDKEARQVGEDAYLEPVHSHRRHPVEAAESSSRATATP